MATPIIMPRQGQSVESCVISKWSKNVGDTVSNGDLLFTYETDKATFDETAKEEGTLLAIFANEGDDVPCLQNVCVIGKPGESFAEFDPKGSAPAQEAPKAAAPAAPAAVAAPVAQPAAGQNVATAVIMPRQGQSVESCVISKWAKKVGDKIAKGDLLFTYETDKATFDEAAQVEGTLLAIFANEGDDVPCLQNVCAIGNEGDFFASLDPNGSAVSAPVAQTAATAAPVAETVAVKEAAPVEVKANDGIIKISPRARMAAKEKGVNPAFVTGTGAEGRIIEKDIIEAAKNATFAAGEFVKEGITGTGIGGRITTADLSAMSAKLESAKAEAPKAEAPKAEAPKAAPVSDAEYTDEKIPNIRKVIAKAMHESLSTMAQLTLNSSFDATNIIEFRKKLKENAEFLGIGNITINDIVLYAVSRVIMNHKALNANFLDGTTMRYFKNCQLGVAVDTPRGLLVPTLRDANLKSLNEIATEAKTLAKSAQGGTIAPDLLKGGSFTVTNLGTLGIESFTPVINPPQVAILGVDTLMTRVKNVNGEMKMYQAMGLSLTFDHRAIDGAPAARFLQELCKFLENFSVMLVK